MPVAEKKKKKDTSLVFSSKSKLNRLWMNNCLFKLLTKQGRIQAATTLSRARNDEARAHFRMQRRSDLSARDEAEQSKHGSANKRAKSISQTAAVVYRQPCGVVPSPCNQSTTQPVTAGQGTFPRGIIIDGCIVTLKYHALLP